AGNKRSQRVVVDARNHPESSLVTDVIAERGDVAHVLHLGVLSEAKCDRLLPTHPLRKCPALASLNRGPAKPASEVMEARPTGCGRRVWRRRPCGKTSRLAAARSGPEARGELPTCGRPSRVAAQAPPNQALSSRASSTQAPRRLEMLWIGYPIITCTQSVMKGPR